MSRERPARSPEATYRLQLHPGFTFTDAAAITDYLAELGITHLYLSPILQARWGSVHGYDVVDHSRISSELGGEHGLRILVDAWKPRGILLDIVPNHMAVDDPANRWWWDVLKYGPASRYARCFDIDWDPPEAKLKRTILVPILGDHYGRVLEAGELTLDRVADETVVRYHDHVLPLAPGTEPPNPSAAARDPDELHDILETQHYRLARWQVAGRELNYRRFFAINDLAALRIEDEAVFDATHEVILGLVADGTIDGLRIDHVDGLRYPTGYLQRLRARTPGRFLVVEKILGSDEDLPEAWPVEGTTGYDFMARVTGLFIDPDAEKPLSDVYSTFIGHDPDADRSEHEAKFLLMDTELAADIERTTDLFVAVCEDQRRYRDFTRAELRETLRETLAALDVYRTYADPGAGEVDQHDARVITAAIERGRARRPDLDGELFDLLAGVLLLGMPGADEVELAMRFQQTSAPVMAKGVEDTFLYIYNRFVALNEVGGNPLRFGTTVDEFHAHNVRTQRRWPRTMLATSTHDTKRSDDVRARLALLSEIPDEWASAVARWARDNEPYRSPQHHDANMEYLLYQTLVGAWPLSPDRATAYIIKAAREAKIYTSWITPDHDHENALRGFTEGVVSDERFRTEMDAFVTPLVAPGRVNALAMTLLKMTCPGVPDLYQGSELWDLTLVDPDNRRPIDYQMRRTVLESVRAEGLRGARALAEEGGPKVFVITTSLDVRARIPQAFDERADYVPLTISGAGGHGAVAFVRGGRVAVVVPRLAMSLSPLWSTTEVDLPDGSWHEAFSGRRFDGPMSLDGLFADFPVALLTKGQ